jgi:lauroyl/myristoyl acyltransferase
VTAGATGLVGSVAASLTSGGFAAGWGLVKALPEPVAARLFDAGADLAVARGGGGIDRLQANLARVAPGQDLLRPAVRSYARYWREAFRLPSMKPARIVDGTATVGEEAFRASVAAARGTVLALPHSGNWDAAGAWCGLTDVPFTTVAERLRPESLYLRFLEFRESLGMSVLPLTGGDRPPFDVLRERVGAGGVAALLADRDLTPRGVDVSFFQARARMPAGPAKLALETGADLIPTTLSFLDEGWQIVFHPAVSHTDVATMTQQVAGTFEAAIAEHPQDWHMLQRLWLDDLAQDDPRKAPQP